MNIISIQKHIENGLFYLNTCVLIFYLWSTSLTNCLGLLRYNEETIHVIMNFKLGLLNRLYFIKTIKFIFK